MKILIAVTYYHPYISGFTLHAEREARALARRGHHVTVLASQHEKSLPLHEILDGVEVYRAKVLMYISKGALMPTMFLQVLILAKQADVVHLHLPQLDAAPIAMLLRLIKKPIVVTYHCDLSLPSGFVNYVANRVSDLANWITCSLADFIVHNTRDYAEHSPFLRRYLHKVVPIFPPVEPLRANDEQVEAFRQKYALTSSKPVIGMSGRLATEKGVEYLVGAMQIVRQRYPNARVLFVGPYQNVLGEEAYARRLAPLIERLGEHWSFLGVLPVLEQSAFFRACDVTVLPSLNPTESYGLTQVESMASGTPVVASDLPGVRVPVQITGMGRIVRRADAEALAQALLEVLDHPDQYRLDPADFLRKSSADYVAQEYEKVFLIAMGKK